MKDEGLAKKEKTSRCPLTAFGGPKCTGVPGKRKVLSALTEVQGGSTQPLSL